MGVTSREILDIIELVYYVPALFLALWVMKKHGFGRQIGWFYLGILSVLRIVGASIGIAAVHHPSVGLIVASMICFSIGLAPLLFALLGIINRLNEGMKGHGMGRRPIRLAHIPIVVGLILAIIASTKESDSNPNTRSDGYTYLKIAVTILFVAYLLIALLVVVTLTKKRYILEGENRLLLAAIISLPFLGVRLLYSILAAYDHSSSVFALGSNSNTAVIVQAIMSVLMEFIVVAIYITAGIITRAIPRSMVKEGYVDPPNYNSSAPQAQQNAGYNKHSYPQTSVRDQESGTTAFTGQQDRPSGAV